MKKWMTACLMVLVAGSALIAESADLSTTRGALEQWVQTSRLISQEQQEWKIGKEMLQERIDLVRSEIETLNDKIKEVEDSIGETGKKREELTAENKELKAASASLQEAILRLESKTVKLLGTLPTPIVDRVKPLSQRIPENPDTTELSLSERFQNIIGILNEINKFSREITMTSEVRELPNGTSAEVTTVYLGVGQAYYVGANNTVAGIGKPGPNGWGWEPADEIAPQVAEVVAILNNEGVAAFVPLPVTVD